MLCYVDDALPGITRRRYGRSWAYFDPQGQRITDRDEIERLRRIGLPPAYFEAWFCPSPHGHIQAIGFDEKGRKQYRYHPDFRSQQDSQKYERCGDFGRALPLIRARVAADLAGGKLEKQTIVAAVIRLLDLGHVRVGNEAYAKTNRSYGATTLRNRHAAVRGGRVKLEFRGKSGKIQRIAIEDKRLAALVRKCQDLPGQQLFQYLDAEGAAHPVRSCDVNAYLREAAGGDFTAKHFRTWGASAISYALLAAGTATGVAQLLAAVAEALGNTPAIARKSYVHPALIAFAKAPERKAGSRIALPHATKYLSAAERGLIAFLDELPQVDRIQAEAA